MSVDEDLFDLKLVQIVEQNPHLYNKETRDFKDKIKRYKSWEAIGNILGTSGEYCERRWNVLRTRFAKEKRTEKEKISIGVETDCSPQWVLFKPMSFLSRHVKSRNSYKGLSISSPSPYSIVDVKVNSMASDESNNDNSNIEGSSDYSMPFKNDTQIVKTEQIDNTYETDKDRLKPLIEDDHSNDSMEFISDETSKYKRRKLDNQEISRHLISNVKFISDYFRKKMDKQEDSDYAFAKMICMQLKEIDNTEKKNIIKAKIMKCFLSESNNS